MKPTKETYIQLDHAYSFFNKKLFKDELPGCMITLQRKRGTYGYFWGDTWSAAKGKQLTDEIALNPDSFHSRSLKEVLATLVHEMCHLQQHHFGKPSLNGYHNKEWAFLMELVGLTPTDTGRVGGKKTGQKVTHLINKGGRFDQACTQLLDKGFTIPWKTHVRNEKIAAKKRASKTRYTCPSCELNAWAKPNTQLICGNCKKELEAQEL